MIRFHSRRIVGRLLLIGLFCVLSSMGRCRATNIHWIPGDALFPSTMSERWVQNLPTDGGTISLTFLFRNDPVGGSFCGYAGFSHLEISDASPRMVASLQTLYRFLRTRTPQELVIFRDEHGVRQKSETNSFQVLVYNRDAAWNEQRLCLKYNSQWHTFPPESAIGSRGDERFDEGTPITERMGADAFQPFLDDYRAIGPDWRDADYFPGLKAEIPPGIAWGIPHGEFVKAAIIAKAAEIQFVIFPSPQEKPIQYFLRSPGQQFFTITEDGISEHMWDGSGELVSAKWTPEFGRQGGIEKQLVLSEKLDHFEIGKVDSEE